MIGVRTQEWPSAGYIRTEYRKYTCVFHMKSSSAVAVASKLDVERLSEMSFDSGLSSDGLSSVGGTANTEAGPNGQYMPQVQ
jgi:hypothetical protein